MGRVKKIIFQPQYRKKHLLNIATKCRLPFLVKFIENKKLLTDIRQLYFNVYRQYPNLDNPQTLNEKLLWLAYYWRHPLKALCADKYKCREYVTKYCGLNENLLVPLLGVWDKAEDIDFKALPIQFVLKCNHGCGYNIIVKDNSVLDITHAKEQLNRWLAEDYAGNVSEIHYREIKPHKIICEQYLPAIGDDSSIIDYKLMCFNGVPHFFFVAYNRDEAGEATFCTFSLEWKQLFYIIDEIKIDLPKPASLNKMIEYAHVLSKNFPFVRVDFYDLDGKPLLGEMTFTPYGNILTYFIPNVIAKYGEILQLPPKYKVREN